MRREMRRQHPSLWKIGFCAGALLLWPLLTWAGPLHVGSISTRPAAEVKKFLPFATFLAKELKSAGIDQGKVVVARSISHMATLLREGKVDIFIDSPFPSLAVSRLSGSKFLVRRWKKGIGEYHSIIFARKDSGISRLEDLKGKIIAFEEPFSSSGYFFPKMALLQEGLRLVPRRDPLEPVGPGEVGYVFSGDDESTMVWVLRGKVTAGATDHQSYPQDARGNLDSLSIIYKTFPFPRQIVSHRTDLPPPLVAKIKEVLIRMDRTEEGKKALEDFEQTTKFDAIPDQNLAPLLKAGRLIDLELGPR